MRKVEIQTNMQIKVSFIIDGKVNTSELLNRVRNVLKLELNDTVTVSPLKITRETDYA